MLSVSDIHTYYGHIKGVAGVSIDVGEGEVVTVIGANGAGKTTLMHTIIGLVKPRSGAILFDGKEISNLASHRRVNLGISLVPEDREVFPRLTVYENLRLGLKKRIRRITTQEWSALLESIYELFPRLAERTRQSAGTLSGGEQQMLVMARALVGRPKLLLLDEPSLGLAPILVREVFQVIRRLKEEGTTIVLVEQLANQALDVADRGYVLEHGEVVLSGTSSELRGNADVARAYLGGRGSSPGGDARQL